MYGQNLDYRQPMVREILLEMQRRKSNYGIDGIRVDGAQDFKYWDAEAGQLYHDDDYLRRMNELVQEGAGVQYRPVDDFLKMVVRGPVMIGNWLRLTAK